MGETAEERARRLRQRITQGIFGWSEETLCYEQMLDEVCREMIIVMVREEPDVSLVKEYGKGSFKFV
jgi:hypothetical protein